MKKKRSETKNSEAFEVELGALEAAVGGGEFEAHFEGDVETKVDVKRRSVGGRRRGAFEFESKLEFEREGARRRRSSWSSETAATKRRRRRSRLELEFEELVDFGDEDD